MNNGPAVDLASSRDQTKYLRSTVARDPRFENGRLWKPSHTPHAFLSHLSQSRPADIIIMNPPQSPIRIVQNGHRIMYIFSIESASQECFLHHQRSALWEKTGISFIHPFFIINFSNFASLIERVNILSIWSQLPTFFLYSRQRPPWSRPLSRWSAVLRTRLALRKCQPKSLPNQMPRRSTYSPMMLPGIPWWR